MRNPRNLFRTRDPRPICHTGSPDGQSHTHFGKLSFKTVARRTMGALFKAPSARAIDKGTFVPTEQPDEPSVSTMDVSLHKPTEAAETTESIPTSLIPFIAVGSWVSDCPWCNSSTEASSSASSLDVSEPEQPLASEDSVSRQSAHVELTGAVNACSTPLRQVKSLVRRIRPRRGVPLPPRVSVRPAVIPDECWLGWDVCQAVVKGEHVPVPMDSLMDHV